MTNQSSEPVMTASRAANRGRASAAGRAVAAGRAAAGAVPVLADLRLARPDQPLTSRWSERPVQPRAATMLGISYRPLQAAALGLDPHSALTELLRYPFELVRLAAYWDRMEPAPGSLDPAGLDDQISRASQAGKKIILCVGAVKAFGYPEFFVPAHRLPSPLPERTLIRPQTHPELLAAATGFITSVVERYRDQPAIVAWQVEHEAVDPLGLEHSWRLAADFVAREVDAVRTADPGRPVMLNGFLPTSLPVRLQQHWRTRDQGDSLAVACEQADIVGIDLYPRHGLVRLGPRTAYLAGSQNWWQQRAASRVCAAAAGAGRRLMIAEGQAEPWETVTTPPSQRDRGMFSCLPEHVIDTYNQGMHLGRHAPAGLWAYLFWGAEYWLRRAADGDRSYLAAFGRVLAGS
jgi:hypothetical protein